MANPRVAELFVETSLAQQPLTSNRIHVAEAAEPDATATNFDVVSAGSGAHFGGGRGLIWSIDAEVRFLYTLIKKVTVRKEDNCNRGYITASHQNGIYHPCATRHCLSPDTCKQLPAGTRSAELAGVQQHRACQGRRSAAYFSIGSLATCGRGCLWVTAPCVCCDRQRFLACHQLTWIARTWATAGRSPSVHLGQSAFRWQCFCRCRSISR